MRVYITRESVHYTWECILHMIVYITHDRVYYTWECICITDTFLTCPALSSPAVSTRLLRLHLHFFSVNRCVRTIFLDSIYTCYLFSSFWLISLCITGSSFIPSLQLTQMHSFCDWVILHCVCVPHCLYPFICQWIFRLIPCPGYCKYVLLWTFPITSSGAHTAACLGMKVWVRE